MTIMPNHCGSVSAVAIWACLLASTGVHGQASASGGAMQTQWAETLRAQRKDIEELKVLFAKIDKRMGVIERIEKRIEAILENPDATAACAVLEQVAQIEVDLRQRLGAAPIDTEKSGMPQDRDPTTLKIGVAPTAAQRAKVQQELERYQAIFQKAKQAASHYDCRE